MPRPVKTPRKRPNLPRAGSGVSNKIQCEANRCSRAIGAGAFWWFAGASMGKGPTGLGKTDRDAVLVDFALQGGGSHGAFTWGVLDRLLEEPWLKVEAISGTSAGAMNAAVLVS